MDENTTNQRKSFLLEVDETFINFLVIAMSMYADHLTKQNNDIFEASEKMPVGEARTHQQNISADYAEDALFAAGYRDMIIKEGRKAGFDDKCFSLDRQYGVYL